MEGKNDPDKAIDIEKYIEENIEKKINQFFAVLPQNVTANTPKMIYEYTIYELYSGTVQTIIDIINESTELYADKNYIESQVFRKRMFDIIFKENRKIFIGISLVVLSFIIYFIDGANA